MANTTGDIRTVDEILGDEVQFSLKAGRSYIILSLSCVETLTKQWKDKLQEVWELQELNEHLEDKLKEREAVEPTLIREGRNKNYNDYVCPRCDNEVVYEQNYCSECGMQFLWEGR